MREAIKQALRHAMKARDAALTSTLRLISAAIKERDIEARGKGRQLASDEELLASLARMIRQRGDSAAAYESAGRPELAAKELAEIEVIRRYMPEQMSEEEARAAIVAAISEAGATSPRDMGRVMAILKERHSGQLDLGKASAAVKAMLE